jgi:hypothetical protein
VHLILSHFGQCHFQNPILQVLVSDQTVFVYDNIQRQYTSADDHMQQHPGLGLLLYDIQLQ